MNAKEMFKQLGYKPNDFDEPTDNIISYVNIELVEIWFDTNTETYDKTMMITKKEHKAITQQMKELGWIE